MVTRYLSAPATPHDRGLQFGRCHRAAIERTVAAYTQLFARVAPGTPLDLASHGAAALARIEQWAPDLAGELRGIALGAEQPVTTIAALNARTEILAALRATGGATVAGECSTVVALGTGPTVAVQNWDWFAGMADNWLVWQIDHLDGRRTTTVTEYGILGKIGVNSAGVGTLFNILHHQDDGVGPIGVPVHIIARAVLDGAVDIDSAVAIVTSATVSASTALTVVGPGAKALTAEIWPGGPSLVPPVDGLLLHTNHFLDADPAAGDTEPADAPDTLARYRALLGRLGGRGVDVDTTAALAALTDHSGGSDAVCCHRDDSLPVGEQYQTLATVRLDLERGEAHCTAGTPCLAVL